MITEFCVMFIGTIFGHVVADIYHTYKDHKHDERWEEAMSDYKNEIKEYITQKGISQSFICKKTGISEPKLSMSLNGKRELSIEEYALICGALEVDTNYFVHPHLPNIRG